MDSYPHIQTIRYVGNKHKLLNFIIPQIKKISEEGDLIIDMFAGTCSISYALKARNKIITNDLQDYSNVIAKALIEGKDSISKECALNELGERLNGKKAPQTGFFEATYSNTYFTQEQCKDIDSLRDAIEDYNGPNKNLYLTCLMSAMSYCVNSPGHFAEFFKNKYFIYGDRSITEYFLNKCEAMEIVKGRWKNEAVKGDYTDFIKRYSKYLKKSTVIYADPPYSEAQYSRFYHLLDTVTKYDQPEVEHEAKYRNDRIQSGFSKRSTVNKEFSNLFELCSTESDAALILSYVNHGRGLLSVKELRTMAMKFYKNVAVRTYKSYKHSMNGNGKPLEVEELLFICK